MNNLLKLFQAKNVTFLRMKYKDDDYVRTTNEKAKSKNCVKLILYLL